MGFQPSRLRKASGKRNTKRIEPTTMMMAADQRRVSLTVLWRSSNLTHHYLLCPKTLMMTKPTMATITTVSTQAKGFENAPTRA